MKRVLQFGLSVLVAIIAASCSRNDTPPAALSAGRVVAGPELSAAAGGAFMGDRAYAVVSSSALHAYYDDFRSEIFRQGVTKWDERFDCNHFAGYYVSLAQTRFYLANFHSSTPAQTLALGVYWYRPRWANGQGHAIVIAMTERGLVWIEPQNGQEVALTPAEQATAYLKVF